jgi:hypothetical protein
MQLPESTGVLLSCDDLDDDGVTDPLYATWAASLHIAGEVVDLDDPAPGNGQVGAVAPFDLDWDGHVDLFVGDRSCETVARPFRQVAPGAFEPIEVSGDSTGVRTDAMLVLPLEDGRRLAWTIGAACDHTQPDAGALLETASGTWVAHDPTDDRAIWKLDPASVGAPYTRWMPMGAAATDLDDDGFFDVVLALGYPYLVVLRGDGTEHFRDVTYDAGLRLPNAPNGNPEVPWSIGTPDLDLDGRPDLVVTIGDDDTTFQHLDGHAMVTRAYWNAGDFQFVDVTEQVGLADFGGSWRGLTLHDPDGDGDADLAMGGFGVAPRVLRNDLAVDGHHGLSLRLRGQTSEPTASGTTVTVHTPAGSSRHLVGHLGNPFGRSESLVFAGLGPHAEAEVEVRWASGLVETRVLDAGHHRWVEPDVVRFDAWEGPADGAHELVGRVGVSDVEILLEGAGSLDRQDDRVVVTAPDQPGESRLVLTLDGARLRVSPRLIWR